MITPENVRRARMAAEQFIVWADDWNEQYNRNDDMRAIVRAAENVRNTSKTLSRALAEMRKP